MGRRHSPGKGPVQLRLTSHDHNLSCHPAIPVRNSLAPLEGNGPGGQLLTRWNVGALIAFLLFVVLLWWAQNLPLSLQQFLGSFLSMLGAY